MITRLKTQHQMAVASSGRSMDHVSPSVTSGRHYFTRTNGPTQLWQGQSKSSHLDKRPGPDPIKSNSTNVKMTIQLSKNVLEHPVTSVNSDPHQSTKVHRESSISSDQLEKLMLKSTIRPKYQMQFSEMSFITLQKHFRNYESDQIDGLHSNIEDDEQKNDFLKSSIDDIIEKLPNTSDSDIRPNSTSKINETSSGEGESDKTYSSTPSGFSVHNEEAFNFNNPIIQIEQVAETKFKNNFKEYSNKSIPRLLPLSFNSKLVPENIDSPTETPTAAHNLVEVIPVHTPTSSSVDEIVSVDTSTLNLIPQDQILTLIQEHPISILPKPLPNSTLSMVPVTRKDDKVAKVSKRKVKVKVDPPVKSKRRKVKVEEETWKGYPIIKYETLGEEQLERKNFVRGRLRTLISQRTSKNCHNQMDQMTSYFETKTIPNADAHPCPTPSPLQLEPASQPQLWEPIWPLVHPHQQLQQSPLPQLSNYYCGQEMLNGVLYDLYLRHPSTDPHPGAVMTVQFLTSENDPGPISTTPVNFAESQSSSQFDMENQSHGNAQLDLFDSTPNASEIDLDQLLASIPIQFNEIKTEYLNEVFHQVE